MPNMPIDLDKTEVEGARIRVIGVGGGGGNAVNNMIIKGLKSVDFIAANTDKQALDHNLAAYKIYLGKNITKGLGAGSDREVGKESVNESEHEIIDALEGSDMVFVTCGMGGGTGTGGSPNVAKIARELGALVVGIVTKPFTWEGRKRALVAEAGIAELREYVDALIIIPNQRLLEIIPADTNFGDAFLKVDEVLYNATRGIADIISQHGVVNVDFADVRTVMKDMGDAIMGIGVATGENRAIEATEKALNSPLLDGVSINGALGVLVNITGGSDMKMQEVAAAVTAVEQAAGLDANLIHGVVYRDEPCDEISVTVVATGFNKNKQSKPATQQEASQFARYAPVQLPFQKDKIMENSQQPAYNVAAKPKITVGGAGPMLYNNIEEQVISSPKGLNNLKEYDKPAFERKLPKDQQEDFEKSLGKIERLDDAKYNLKDPNVRQNFEKPAFLRKIMD